MITKIPWIRYATDALGAWWGVMSGALSIPFCLLALLNVWSQQRTFGVLAVVSALVTMFSMASSNHQLRKQLEPRLEIDGVDAELGETRDNVHRVRVRNRSGDITADSVEVQLLDIDYAYRANGNPPLPKSLLPEKRDATSINPSNALTFDLLTATFDRDWQKQTPGAAPQKRYPIWARTTVPGDAIGSVYTAFETDKKYRIKVKATTRNFPPTIQEFDMQFSTVMSVCRFMLTKV